MRQALRALRPYARRRRGALVGGGLLAVLGVLVDLAVPWPVSLLVGRVLSPGHPDLPVSTGRAVALVIAATVLITGAAALIEYAQTILLASTGLRMAADLRLDVFSHLQRLSLRYHADHRIGDLSTRVTADVDKMQELIVQALDALLPNLLLLTGMFTVMVVMDPGFAAVALITTPVMAVIVYRSTKALTMAARRARKADGQVAAAATEGLGAVHLVQAFSLERPMRRRLRSLTDSSLDSGLEAVRLQAIFAPAVDLAGAVSAAVVIGYGSWRVLHGDLTLEFLLVFMGYVASLYKPIRALSKLSTVLTRGIAAADRVTEVLSSAPDVRDRPDARVVPRVHGRLDFEQVCYSYGREPVLRDLSLRVEAGERLALVGPTGAGKSTIAALVPRLMDPQRGVVRLDGTDLRRLTLASLRAQVSLVLQDCLLLDGTLFDNIACGRPGATQAQVRRAIRLALVDEFSDRLPDGLDTVVGERGASLSGGQRQRVAIARAIVRDAPILVLDEPTSALDAQSEELIVAALERLPADRTTIVIAHRLSTVRRADQVAVLADGRVVEHGSPADLISAGGRFADLAGAQGLRAPVPGGASTIVQCRPAPHDVNHL
jgi:ATP-binding cassette, subfamily B, bacterial